MQVYFLIVLSVIDRSFIPSSRHLGMFGMGRLILGVDILSFLCCVCVFFFLDSLFFPQECVMTMYCLVGKFGIQTRTAPEISRYNVLRVIGSRYIRIEMS